MSPDKEINLVLYLIYIPFSIALLKLLLVPIILSWKKNDLSHIKLYKDLLRDKCSYIPILTWITTLAIGYKLLSFNTLLSSIAAALLLTIFILQLTFQKTIKPF
ncbi:hypothetical protein COE58_24390 [Bacillus cereus]|nr:hypothetical protein COE58_24390 [Bacillus cereus]